MATAHRSEMGGGVEGIQLTQDVVPVAVTQETAALWR